MKKILLFLAISLSLFAVEDIRLKKAIEMSKDPAQQTKAAEKLLALSLEGETKAMTQLGRLFLYGKGIPQDCKKGTYFLINALSKKEGSIPDPEAMKELALMFKRGLCVKKNEVIFKKYMDKYLHMKKEF